MAEQLRIDFDDAYPDVVDNLGTLQVLYWEQWDRFSNEVSSNHTLEQFCNYLGALAMLAEREMRDE